MATFQQLPVEIREMIYEYALRLESQLGRVISAHGPVSNSSYKRLSSLLSAICFTNKTECSIAIPILIRHTVFSICCHWCSSQVLSFLDRLPGTFAHKAVRTVEFDRYSLDSIRDVLLFDIRLMLQCPSLRKITILLSMWAVIEPSDITSVSLLTGAQILQNQNLGRVVVCKALREVAIKVQSPSFLYGELEDGLKGLREVGEWIEADFAQKGKMDVTVTVSYQ